MAQGFRARMNNFHSILIVVLNTALMETCGDLVKRPFDGQMGSRNGRFHAVSSRESGHHTAMPSGEQTLFFAVCWCTYRQVFAEFTM